MYQFRWIEVTIVEIEWFQVEVFLVFNYIVQRDTVEGIGDDEAIFFVWLCFVFMVDSAMMAERCCMSVVINDKSFDDFTICKEAIIEIHLCLVDSSKTL